MAGRPRIENRGSASSGQGLASLAVLALLCAIAAFLLVRQPRLNPAVEVSLRAPAPKAGVAAVAGATAGTAAGGAETTAPAPEDAAATPNAAGRGPVATLASLLPDVAPGVKALAAAESFTPATLSDKIDGKAEMYLAAGFAAMSCRSYQAQGSPSGQTPVRIELYLYRMKSLDAAFAVFSGQRRPGSAQSGLAKNGYLTENALFLTSGPNYLEVIADRAGTRPALEALAKAVLAALEPAQSVAGNAKSGEKPGAQSDVKSEVKSDVKPGAKPAADLQPPDLFPKAGLKADSLRLAVADAFGCQGLTSVYTAEYDSSRSGAAALLSRRKNPAEAAAQLKLYQRFLTDNGFAAQSAPGAPAGAVVLALEGIGVELLFTRGPWLAGGHEAPTLDAALRLAADLDAALKARGILP